MSTKSESLGQEGMEDLSALLDGGLALSEVSHACQRWRSDPQARATWHAYQLIGDVLRSEDLASAPGHDSDFLVRLRGRLAQEPVILAPSAGPEKRDRHSALPGRRPFRTSVAMAAGFAAVAGVLVVTQLPVSSPSGGAPFVAPTGQISAVQRAAAIEPARAGAPAGAGAERRLSAGEAATVLDGKFIRDARLDEYLAAHKRFGGSSAPGGPSGFLRNATAEGR